MGIIVRDLLRAAFVVTVFLAAVPTVVRFVDHLNSGGGVSSFTEPYLRSIFPQGGRK